MGVEKPKSCIGCWFSIKIGTLLSWDNTVTSFLCSSVSVFQLILSLWNAGEPIFHPYISRKEGLGIFFLLMEKRMKKELIVVEGEG